jgi:hemoglobin-like flavoprotein
MTPYQIAMIQRSYRELLPIGTAAGQIFYWHLFTLDPSLRPLFHGDLDVQATKVIQMVGILVEGLGQRDNLGPTIRALGQRHRGYGVQARHFDAVGKALLWTLSIGLGARFTDEVKAAWSALYADIAAGMQEE